VECEEGLAVPFWRPVRGGGAGPAPGASPGADA